MLVGYYKNKNFYDINEHIKYKLIGFFFIFTLIICFAIIGPTIIANISTRTTMGSNMGYQEPIQYDSSGQYDPQYY